jgi:hypothetical protein
VRLTAAGQTVRVSVRDLEVDGGGGGGRAKAPPSTTRDGGGDGGGGSGRDAKRSRRSPSPPPPPSRPWLRPGILVKIIDKGAGRGKLYLRKAAVVDVPSPGVATLALLPQAGADGAAPATPALPPPSDLLPGVRQAQVETAVPRAAGAAVLVVGGRHAGSGGTLLQRSAEGVGAVQLAADLAVVRLGFDDFAERAPPGWGWSGRGEEDE